MSVRVHELGHVVLYVRDVKRSAAFYREVLGWKQLDVSADIPVALFSSGRTHHELLLIEVGEAAGKVKGGYRTGMYHFGLKMGDSDDELREVVRALYKNGVEIAGATGHGATHSVYIEDPDGNEIELYIDVQGIDWRASPELIMTPPRPLEL